MGYTPRGGIGGALDLGGAARANSLAFFDGGYEPDAVRFLTRCYDRDEAFLDIGDNIGLISLPFADISL